MTQTKFKVQDDHKGHTNDYLVPVMCFETRVVTLNCNVHVRVHLVPNSAVSAHEKMVICNAKIYSNIGKIRVFNLHSTV